MGRAACAWHMRVVVWDSGSVPCICTRIRTRTRTCTCQVIMWDSGNSVGEVGGGHIKKIVSCSYKPTRPFRIITGSEDLKARPALARPSPPQP